MNISRSLEIAFAPDWREGNRYQAYLAQSLSAEGVSVRYIEPCERGFPLSEAAKGDVVRLIHLHWPEAFFNTSGRAWRIWTRKIRYLIDLPKAAAARPLILTAHNLYPHNRSDEPMVRHLIRMTYAKAQKIIAHSPAAAQAVQSEFGIDADKMHVIPHGSGCDSAILTQAVSINDARARLNLGKDGAFCLMYGLIAPYKGIEEAIEFWKKKSPDCDLRIVGLPKSPEYHDILRKSMNSNPRIHLEARWQSNEEVVLWLRAANCALFNYTQILTSGAAIEARALGVPILLPRRLTTVDLGEPHPLVNRFSSFDHDFSAALSRAVASRADYSLAEEFRRQTSWSAVAKRTAEVYRSVLDK